MPHCKGEAITQSSRVPHSCRSVPPTRRTGAAMDLRLKLEDSLQEVDARLVLIGEGAFLMALPPLRDEDLPVLPERQQAQCLVPFAVEAIERWVHPSGLDNLSDLTDCHGFHYPTVPAFGGSHPVHCQLTTVIGN